MSFEAKAVISGIGQSEVGRRLPHTGVSLTVDAALAAIADAGLTPADINGIATYPSVWHPAPGFAGAGLFEVKEALGLNLDWYMGGAEAAQYGPIIDAWLAVGAGLADHVLCFRTVTEASAQAAAGGRGAVLSYDRSERIGGFRQWQLPFGDLSPANWLALYASRHFHEYGTTREQLGWIAINSRRNAALNPAAVFRTPLTLDDYLAARIISTPLCLYDCDVPVDGSTAIIVSRADIAPDLPHPAVRLRASGAAMRGPFSWDQWDDMTTMAARDAASIMWERTDLRPGDVDVAELYDGFSNIALVWLEALGFCGPGEGGPFVEGAHRIALEGQLPMNTNGGQLSAGRLHGYGHLFEACTQLLGRGGQRQVEPRPRVAVAAAGGGYFASCLLLTSD